ncbi:MAG: ATP synthase F1 subunit epsilon [Bdellovibrionia bacterium]
MLKLSILSPERRLVEGASVSEVTLKGSEGDIQILPGHAPMVGTLDIGAFVYRSTDGSATVGVIAGGFFEVRDDQLTVLAETVELKNEIDLEGARKAQKEAEDALKEANIDEHNFKLYQFRLEKALIQQQVASKDHH